MDIILYIVIGIIAVMLALGCIVAIPLLISLVIDSWAELIETIKEHLQ